MRIFLIIFTSIMLVSCSNSEIDTSNKNNQNISSESFPKDKNQLNKIDSSYTRNDTVYSHYDSGELAIISPHDSNGNKIGVEKAFYRNGNLKWSFNYFNNLAFGLAHEYYPTGVIHRTIFMDINYQNDMRYDIKYDSLGNLIDTIFYKRTSDKDLYNLFNQ